MLCDCDNILNVTNFHWIQICQIPVKQFMTNRVTITSVLDPSRSPNLLLIVCMVPNPIGGIR